MLNNNLKYAWRYLLKDRQFSFLNIIGLSTGLACTILIYLWVKDEEQMDQFHAKSDRLYQVMENRVQASGIWTATSSPAPMAEALQKDMPQVEYAVTVIPTWDISYLANKEKKIRAVGRYAGKDFFNVFSYHLIRGNADKVLTDKGSIAVSDILAMRLFGSTDVIGNTVETGEPQHRQVYRVSGVFSDPGPHSSDQFDFILSVRIVLDTRQDFNNWDNTFAGTYLTLKPGVSVDRFNARIGDYIRRKTNNQVTYRTPFVTRYSDIYLHGRYQDGRQVGGRIEYVRLFSIIAIFILVIACINFMNLSTAKAAGRGKEVGIRKVVGAGRGTLILQYLGESMLMATASMLLAVLLVVLFLPAFNGITGKRLDLDHPGIGLLLSLAGITLFTGLASGWYPALYLSGFAPSLVLKGKLKNAGGELLVRKGLVVFQFTLSFLLILGVLVVYRQIRFIQTTNLGYDRDHIIYISQEGQLRDGKQQASFLAEARNIPGIIHASSIGHNLTGHNNGTNDVEWDRKDPKDKTEFEAVPVDYDMLETLGISMQQGRSFSRSFGADSTKIIFNEAAIRFMGLNDPIGKKVKLWGREFQIVGVAKDFHFTSLHEKVKPLFFYLDPGNTWRLMARIETGKEQQVIGRLAQLYRQFNPGLPFEYSFLDTDYQNLYAAERRVSVLSRYFAGLAILISCLGLFGLAAFTAERRRKEIGIRKVLGASARSVVILLSKDFLKLALIAILLAFPLSWWMASQWLSSFAYRIYLGAGIFMIAGCSIIFITLLTVSFQAVNAAVSNPVKSLKAE
ncbi:MAG TPA: ABC transporter permease [Puia sp.]|nr:ABC transporter permease [Puia sp.]